MQTERLSSKAQAVWMIIANLKEAKSHSLSDWTTISAMDIMTHSVDIYCKMTVRKYMQELENKGYIQRRIVMPKPYEVKILRTINGDLVDEHKTISEDSC